MGKIWMHLGGLALLNFSYGTVQEPQRNPDYDCTPGSNYGPIQ
ncbi:hypothetical protein PD5205_01483 [Xanthomonas fragariae]|uniref:Uncharacterized protein n=1 Tax=Xanthomonas fragariae TaxID=48664 RepID=A0A1Y6H5F8_9XANT|nr:hypothetical protein NBC2815_01516 [Xanthomonas fragariae]SMQ98758.1 hypothetical protein PD885_01508 [Xanthomonas fragariae]SMR02792.1 hypothetical protein PD5205_01483 [Xanthomonas fragariae]